MNVACALKVAESAPAGSVIVVIICDTGERYLSKHHSDEWLKEKHFLDANRIVLKTVLQTKSSAKQLPPLVSLSSSDRLDEALKIMKAFELSEIPIIDNGQLVGIVRENRVMSSVIDDPVNKENSITTVIEPTPPTLDCNEDIERAVVELKRFALIIVTEFGAPVGVISRHDIIEYI